MRIDVGGVRILSDWIAHSPIRNLASVRLEAGIYDLKVELFDDWYDGRIELNVYEKRGDKLVLISPGCFQHDPKLLRGKGR